MAVTAPPALLGPLFTTEEMTAAFCDGARLQGMLDFEAALASAEAEIGVIPAPAGEAIEKLCTGDRFDFAILAAETAAAGNPAIPMVKQLTALVAASNPESARYVHWGATSQDATDTGLVLQIRSALGVLERDLGRLSAALAHLAEAHANTPMAGRTLLQQAVPVTF